VKEALSAGGWLSVEGAWHEATIKTNAQKMTDMLKELNLDKNLAIAIIYYVRTPKDSLQGVQCLWSSRAAIGSRT
jgi:hypothetical protein